MPLSLTMLLKNTICKRFSCFFGSFWMIPIRLINTLCSVWMESVRGSKFLSIYVSQSLNLKFWRKELVGSLWFWRVLIGWCSISTFPKLSTLYVPNLIRMSKYIGGDDRNLKDINIWVSGDLCKMCHMSYSQFYPTIKCSVQFWEILKLLIFLQ